MRINIEKATPSDVAEILDLQRTAYQSEAEIYNDFTIQPLTQTLDEATAEFAESVVLKAVCDDKIVGSVRAFQKEDTAYIGKLMVLPEYQNQGIGKRLLQAIESEFNVSRFELFTGFKSEKNIAVYEKSGYEIFKTEAVTEDLSFVYMEKISRGNTTNTMNIRLANKSDLKQLLELYTQLHVNVMQIIDKRLELHFDSILSNKNHHVIVGEIDGKIISSCVIVIIENLTHNQRPYALVENVITDKLYRGNGYATRLLYYARDIAAKQNCYKIMLMTGSKDESTLGFYERAGYNRNDKTAFIQWID